MKMKHALSKTFSSKNFPGWPNKSSGISIYPEIVFFSVINMHSIQK